MGKHECPWCPVETRDLYGVAANVVANLHNPNRLPRKLGELKEAVEKYGAQVDKHFEERD